MKKIKYILFFALAFSTLAKAQEQLDFRISSATLTSGSPDSLEVTIQIRSSTGSSCLRTTQLYLNYNSDAFGSNVVSNKKIRIEKGSLIEDVTVTGIPVPQAIYTIDTSDNTTSKFGFTVTTNQSSVTCGTDLIYPGSGTESFATVPSTWIDFAILHIAITDGTKLPNITWDSNLSSGQQFFQTVSANPEQSALPDSFFLDLDVYPLHTYDIIWDGAVWSGGGGTGNAPSSSDAANELLVEFGQTDPLPGNASVLNLIILDGGTLDLGGYTLTVMGSTMGTVNGSFINGTVEYAGSAAQEITGETNWDNITVNNSNGLTINSGSQNISGVLTPTSGTLTTNGLVTMVASSPSEYGQIAPGSGTISGDVTFQMYISQSGWHNLASPIASMTLDDLEDDILITYDGNSGGVSALKWDPSTADWINATDSSDAFTGGWNFYISDVFVPDGGGVNGDGNLPVILDLTGTVNDGSFSPTLGFNNSSPSWSNFDDMDATDGWNLIANPFPSNIDWHVVAGNIKDLGVNGSYYIWDPSIGGYVTHNGFTGSAGRTSTIAPMQAIWVKLDDAGAISTNNFDFGDAERTVSGPATLAKTTEILRLELVKDTSAIDEAILVRELGYSVNYDAHRDAVKQLNPGKANLYYISADTTTLALSTIGMSFEGDTLMMGIKATHGQSYSIRVSEDSMPADFTQKLVDRKTGMIHDLSNGAYTFVHDTAFSEHRFNLMNIASDISVEEENGLSGTNRSFEIRQSNNGELAITFPRDISSRCDLNVVDMMGRVIHTEENIDTRNTFHFSFVTNTAEQAVYVIRLIDTKTEEVWNAKIIY